MSYVGSFGIDDNLTFYATTSRFDTGNGTDADSAPTYRVYEEETATPILTGTMALLDSTNTAGFYSEQIALTAANGFEQAKCYAIYIAGTVNSVNGVDYRVFQIGAKVNAWAISGDTAAADNLEAAADGTGYNLGGGSIVAASVTGAVGSVTGAVGSVTGNVGGNVTGSVGSVTGAVGSVTGNVGGSVASVTGNVGGNVVGSVGSVAAGGITASSIATDAIDADALAADAVTEIQSGLSTLNAAGVRTAVGMAAADLDTQLDAILAASGGGSGAAIQLVHTPIRTRPTDYDSQTVELGVGDALTVRFDVIDSADDPVSLSGATVTGRLYNLAGTQVGANMSATIIDASGGRCSIAITSTHTATAGTYRVYLTIVGSATTTAGPTTVKVS